MFDKLWAEAIPSDVLYNNEVSLQRAYCGRRHCTYPVDASLVVVALRKQGSRSQDFPVGRQNL